MKIIYIVLLLISSCFIFIRCSEEEDLQNDMPQEEQPDGTDTTIINKQDTIILKTMDDLYAFRDSGYVKLKGSLLIASSIFKELNTIGNTLEEIEGNLIVRYDSVFTQPLKGLEKLNKIGGNFVIKSTAIQIIFGNLDTYEFSVFEKLNNLSEIGGNFDISSTYLRNVTSFKGLSNLKIIGGDFRISQFDRLLSFEGLEQLTNIGGDFHISPLAFPSNNGSTTSFKSLVSFKGLGSLRTIGGNFELLGSHVSLNSLLSLEGLNSLSVIKGKFKIVGTQPRQGDQGALNSFYSCKGINNLSQVGDSIILMNLPILKDYCDLKTVLQNHTEQFIVSGDAYNPTKEQILAGECSIQ